MFSSIRYMRFVTLAAATIALAACANSSNRARHAPPAIGPAPATEIPLMSDVRISQANASSYRFETTAGPSASMTDILAVIYCRVEAYQDENGFDAWKVSQIQRSSGSNPQSPQGVLAIIEFAKAPVPDSFDPVTKDWCAEMQS